MMQLVKSLAILSVALVVLSNCSTPEQIVTTQVVTTPVVTKPRPRPVSLTPVSFNVVTNDNIDSYIEEIESNGEFVFVGISIKSYENLALNFDEVTRYIEQQNSLITYYEGYSK